MKCDEIKIEISPEISSNALTNSGVYTPNAVEILNGLNSYLLLGFKLFTTSDLKLEPVTSDGGYLLALSIGADSCSTLFLSFLITSLVRRRSHSFNWLIQYD
jgi:hypothetical protein